MCFLARIWDKRKYTFTLMMSLFISMTLVVMKLKELFLIPQLQTEILGQLTVSSQISRYFDKNIGKIISIFGLT